jgi:hypothetical protein
MLRAALIALVITCPALTVAGCGSSSKPSTTTAEATRVSVALKLAACMRSHGVPNFPDPTSNGSARSAGTVDKRSPAFRSAQEACRTAQAALAQVKPKQSVAVQLRQAECMRAHGVTNFPDPLPGGGFTVPSTINPQSPAFIAASNACAKP